MVSVIPAGDGKIGNLFFTVYRELKMENSIIGNNNWVNVKEASKKVVPMCKYKYYDRKTKFTFIQYTLLYEQFFDWSEKPF